MENLKRYCEVVHLAGKCATVSSTAMRRILRMSVDAAEAVVGEGLVAGAAATSKVYIIASFPSWVSDIIKE